MSTEAKTHGRMAFRESRWEDCIQHFTAVIEQDPNDVKCLAKRSSAWQKKGDLKSALEDADRTIQLQPSLARGYARKASVLHALKDYSAEVDAYVEGLKHNPDDEALNKGLAVARRLKANASKASQAARTTYATRNAALSRLEKAAQANDMASFVSQTKKNLELQMVALQAQLDLVQELSNLPSDEVLDLLYGWMAPPPPETATLAELTTAIQAASADLLFESQIQTTLQQVDTTLPFTRESFETLIQQLVEALGSNLGDMAQFLVYQILFAANADNDTNPPAPTTTSDEISSSEVPASDEATAAIESPTKVPVLREPRKSVLNNDRMQSLFVLFDKDGDATVDFKEVAIGLYPLTKNMGEAAKNAAGLLLMIDKNDERVLTYQQFAKLMLAVSGVFNMTFDELADQLTWELANQSNEINEAIMQQIVVVEEAYAKAAEQRKEADQAKKTLDALSYSRTRKLFELWDANGDGTIDFLELLHGLRLHQKAAGGKSLVEAERDALMIMGHDQDRNQSLDQEEFAYAMANYAEASGTDLHELIDFMCVVSSEPSPSKVVDYEVQFQETVFQQRTGGCRFRPNMGTILDLHEPCSDDEDEEDDDDDW